MNGAIMTISEIKDLILFAKAEGVCSFEVENVKVSFDPRSFPTQVKFDNAETLKQTISSIMEGQEKLKQDEEDLLFASV
jgi:hypothetical protein